MQPIDMDSGEFSPDYFADDDDFNNAFGCYPTPEPSDADLEKVGLAISKAEFDLARADQQYRGIVNQSAAMSEQVAETRHNLRTWLLWLFYLVEVFSYDPDGKYAARQKELEAEP